TWTTTKDYVIIVLALALYAFGFCAFILPERVVIGGLAGLGSLVFFASENMAAKGILPWPIPVAVTQYAANLILLGIAFRMVGKQFVIRTIFGATVISVFIGILQPLFPEPILHGDKFMSIIIGGICCGIAIGTVFIHNGSTGGTDIVAAMVSKKSNVSIGRVIIYCDFTIISSSYILFHDVTLLVYGFMVTFIVSYVCDMIINTNRQAVQFIIFSSHWEEVATAINNDAHRGCTVLNGMGWYSKHDVKILLVMCRKIEAVTIFRIIKSIDTDAFITQSNVNGVYGKGFDQLKLKMKPVRPKPASSAPASNDGQHKDSAGH
ncbi:MAG: YitT family protein, partial [Muribaculaceae bacterium]|nr:YitT family protein [Muribaculaceae bacterium]